MDDYGHFHHLAESSQQQDEVSTHHIVDLWLLALSYIYCYIIFAQLVDKLHSLENTEKYTYCHVFSKTLIFPPLFMVHQLVDKLHSLGNPEEVHLLCLAIFIIVPLFMVH